MTKDNEWGNIELPGISDSELFDPYINIRINNKNRAGSDEWKKVIDSRRKPQFSDEQRKALSDRGKKLTSDPEFKKKMQKVYKSEEFLEATTKANQNPERCKKISQAHSNHVKTEDGVFTFKEACDKYNMTTEGIRYRIQTREDWILVKQRTTSAERSKQLSEGAKKTAEQRQKAIADKKGYVFTTLGKFYTVRQAWLHHKEQGDEQAIAQQQYGGWFRKMTKLFPNDYYKKIVDKDD